MGSVRALFVALATAAGVLVYSPSMNAQAPGVLPPPSAEGLQQPSTDDAADVSETASEGAAAPGIGDAESIDAPEATPERTLIGGPFFDDLITPTPQWYSPTYWLGPDPWNAGVELGINGSQGINDVLSMRAGGHLKRVTPRWKLDSSLIYNRNIANSIETQNNAKLDARLDRILDGSRWTLFNLNNVIYDEFQAYDLQLSLNAGVGYQLFKTTTLDLLTRFGGGATREFGSPDDEWKPQALFGADYTHKITGTQRLAAKVDYYPEWEDFNRYRVVSDLGWVIDLDQPKNVSLKLSLIDRYDSTPNGVAPNSFDYAVLLIWGL